jgi:hypothetical protein
MLEGEQRPVGEALTGLRVHTLPDGWTPLAAAVLINCLDDKGDPAWVFRTTDGLSAEELLGALVLRTDLLRQELLEKHT